VTRVVLAALLALAGRLAADDRPTAEPFPPLASARRIDGELIAADFIHRTGQFRTADTGEVKDFALPPWGIVRHRNADADLRDVPLGTACRFRLHPDAQGNLTRLARLEDQFSADAAAGVTYRLDEVKAGTLLTTARHGPVKLTVTDKTRVWKGGKAARLADLAAGDELLVNLTGVTGTDAGRCTDVWAGADAHTQATEAQERAHAALLKARGLPGWVDRTEGRTLTVTLIGGDRAAFERAWLADFAAGRTASVVVANDELRTWNPPVDHERGKIVEVTRDPADGAGRGGIRLRVTVNFPLEGFRRGRVVRVFADGWPLKDQPFGEQLFHYGARAFPPELMELPPKEYPGQFPFRTDHGNDHLPWYRLRPDAEPPPYSEHLVLGELVAVDTARRSGRFRADRTGAAVDFSLTPSGTVRYLNVEADLSAIPVGTRCRFGLYQDEAGAFTRAGSVTDEATHLLANGATWRVEASDLPAGKLHAARQPPGVKNDQGDPEQPPDIGRAELRFGPDTRFWKGDRRVRAEALAAGDLLLVNVTGERPGHPSLCTDVWAGADTHRRVVEEQARKAPRRAPR
jgi:hypothetical protein